jgi:glutamate-1-semialdehyde 2,1-aminomutase
MGLVAPQPGFLTGLRRRCDAADTLLVFDEVITGFRVGPGGAQARFGVVPDVSLFGKILGGGLPLAALGGPSVLLDQLAPDGPIYQAGTLAGNPLATAAGLAALAHLDAAVYEELETRVARFATNLAAAFGTAGVPAQVPQVFTLCGVFFAPAPVTDYATASAADAKRYARLFQGLLNRGVFLPPSPFETWFVSVAHGDADLERTVEIVADVAGEISDAG